MEISYSWKVCFSNRLFGTTFQSLAHTWFRQIASALLLHVKSCEVNGKLAQSIAAFNLYLTWSSMFTFNKCWISKSSCLPNHHVTSSAEAHTVSDVYTASLWGARGPVTHQWSSCGQTTTGWNIDRTTVLLILLGSAWTTVKYLPCLPEEHSKKHGKTL